jgi:Uncharacterised nucleotidyltransferase
MIPCELRPGPPLPRTMPRVVDVGHLRSIDAQVTVVRGHDRGNLAVPRVLRDEVPHDGCDGTPLRGERHRHVGEVHGSYRSAVDAIETAQQLRIDATAKRVSEALTTAGIEHVFLKGPSTSFWLYDPPRAYRDVDVLVPDHDVHRAADGLARADVAHASAGGVGEEAPHSLLMLTDARVEVDVHIALPMMSRSDGLWPILREHREPLLVGDTTIPVLDLPGRCVVLALHALASADSTPQVVEDLRRAVQRASPAVWAEAEQLATQLDVHGLYVAGLTLVGVDRSADEIPPLARLKLEHAPSSAIALQQLASAPWHRKLPLLMREIVPSRGFMQQAYPSAAEGRAALSRAHMQRWRRLARDLPAAVRALGRSRG